MCRLFAMSGGSHPLGAEFWLLDAPDSLTAQSHRYPDGAGIGIFDADGRPVVYKAAISAFSDADFAWEARRESSRTFLAHVRFTTRSPITYANTHPFEQEGRLFAHNGVLSDLPRLEDELAEDMALVEGDTDSERLFALITREIRHHEGDVSAGIVAAATWVAGHLPMSSLNLIVTTDSGLYALRYPETHTLYVLNRAAGGNRGGESLEYRSSLGTRVQSEEAAQRPVVVLASEPMDDDPAWRMLESGELLQVTADLEVGSEIALPDPPAHCLDLSVLDAPARPVGGPR
jgi:predicted glutamine amidotransferase